MLSDTALATSIAIVQTQFVGWVVFTKIIMNVLPVMKRMLPASAVRNGLRV